MGRQLQSFTSSTIGLEKASARSSTYTARFNDSLQLFLGLHFRPPTLACIPGSGRHPIVPLRHLLTGSTAHHIHQATFHHICFSTTSTQHPSTNLPGILPTPAQVTLSNTHVIFQAQQAWHGMAWHIHIDEIRYLSRYPIPMIAIRRLILEIHRQTYEMAGKGHWAQ